MRVWLKNQDVLIFQKELKHDALGWTHRPPESRRHVVFLAAAPGSVGVMFFPWRQPGRQGRRHVFLFCRPAAGLRLHKKGMHVHACPKNTLLGILNGYLDGGNLLGILNLYFDENSVWAF